MELWRQFTSALGPIDLLLSARAPTPEPPSELSPLRADRPPNRDHLKPRSKGHALNGNRALACCLCNADKGSKSLGQWLTHLSRAGDPRVDHVAAFIERGPAL